VHSPLAYLYQLTQAARQQRLAYNGLHDTTPKLNPPRHTTPDLHTRLQNLAAQIKGIDQLYALAQIPLDAISAKQRQIWVLEYERLKQQLANSLIKNA
jgi:hypothetical protein